MEPILSAPCTPAQRQRDVLLGALVGLARSTVNEPKTEDTDHVLAAGLRQAANADAAEEALARMTRIVMGFSMSSSVQLAARSDRNRHSSGSDKNYPAF